MSKEGAPNGGREPIKIAMMSFAPATAQGPNNSGISAGVSSLTSREVDPRNKITIEFHPWRRQYKVTNPESRVAFFIPEQRVTWAIDLADHVAAKTEEAARKAA
jgi:hypothetical protein